MILGAGVDRTSGIDFPLANTLLVDVTRYLAGKGKGVEAALRDMLPNLRFNFNSTIARAVDKIATREPHEQRAMVQRVQDVIAHLGEGQESIRKHGELIVRLFNKVPRCFVWTPTFKIRAGVEPDGGVGSWLAELSTCPAGGC